MQERQEFIDRYFVFSDDNETPPKDYSRTNGLLDDIRQAYLALDERKRLDGSRARERRRRTSRSSPSRCRRTCERPAARRTSARSGPRRRAENPQPGGATPPINVNPAVRNIEK